MAGMEDDFREYMEAVFAAASDMYQTLIAQYIADQLDEALSSGGSLYEVIMAGAIAGAMAWYGMYSPEVYQREYSMASESNIQISHSVQVSGPSVTGSYSVQNTSPHAGYSEGFWFYKRGRPFFRPGGDLMANVPTQLTFAVDVPQNIADSCFEQALSAVM